MHADNDNMRLHLLAIALTMASVGSAPAAAQVDTSEWVCQFCPFESGYRADYEVGADFVDDKSVRFGSATGYDESGGYLALGGQGAYRSDDFQAGWRLEDLGLESRRIELDAGRQGKYDVQVGYSELPYRLFGTTSTVYSATAPSLLTLPPGWSRASSTSGFTSLASALTPRDIASDRRRFSVGGKFLPTSNIVFRADFRREERDGVDIVSGANFTQSSLMPRVLDFETDLVDVALGYSGERYNLSLAWFGSFFTNNLDELIWENAFTSPAGNEQRRMAQEPDNEFHQLSLSGSYRADAFDTVIGFSAAVGEGEQDELLLPYTVNPDVSAGALPRERLDGKIETANYELTLAAKPAPRARIKLAYRFDERDNRTPQSDWSRVIVDTFPSNEPGTNIPYSFERTRISATGSYRLFDRLRLSAGYDRNETERDFQEVAEQTEDSGWGKVQWHVGDYLDLAIKGGASKRDIDRYDTTVAQNLGQNPLLRKYNLAYRYREFAELTLSSTPWNGPVAVGLTALWADDNYSRSMLGMTDSQSLHWNIDLGWTPSERTSVYLFGGEENIDADQAGSDSLSAADWFASHQDDFLIYGGGLRFGPFGESVTLRIDYTRADGTTGIVLDRNGASAEGFPDIDSRLTSAKLGLTYGRSDRLDVELDARYESFETNDWSLAGVEPDTIPTVLTLGADPYDYDVWVFGIRLNYKIGDL